MSAVSQITLIAQIVLFIVILVLWVWQMIKISYRDTTKIEDGINFLRYTSPNNQLSPITKIQWQEGDQCPQNYESVILYKFMGTVKGCKCKSSFKATSCGLFDIFTCDTVEPKQGRDFQVWQKKVCIQRNKEWYFIQNCTLAQKKCSSYICVNQQEECPITSMKLLANEFILERDSNKLPVQNISVEIGGQPCLASNQRPYRARTQPDIFFKYKERGCQVYGVDSDSSQEIAQIREKDFYINNGMYDELTRDIPGMSEYFNSEENAVLNQRMTIYQQQYGKCGQFNGQAVYDQVSEYLKTIKELNYSALAAIGVIFFIINIIFLCVGGSSSSRSNTASRATYDLFGLMDCINLGCGKVCCCVSTLSIPLGMSLHLCKREKQLSYKSMYLSVMLVIVIIILIPYIMYVGQQSDFLNTISQIKELNSLQCWTSSSVNEGVRLFSSDEMVSDYTKLYTLPHIMVYIIAAYIPITLLHFCVDGGEQEDK